MKVRRVLVYEGPVQWIENTLKKSLVQPDDPLKMPNGTITQVECVTEEE